VTDENAVTPDPQDGTSPEATPAEPTKPAEAPAPETPKPTPSPDWEAAYKGLQRSQNRAHETIEEIRSQNRLLAETVRALKDGQSTILKSTVGEDEAKRFEAQQVAAAERAAALAAAQNLEMLTGKAIGLVDRTLAAAGLSDDDRRKVYEQAKGANGPEWFDVVHDLARAQLEQSIARRIAAAEDGIKAKTRKEIEAEAESLAQKKLKDAGVDKIDTGKGSSTSDFATRVAKMDPNSAEFKQFYADALAGRLRAR